MWARLYVTSQKERMNVPPSSLALKMDRNVRSWAMAVAFLEALAWSFHRRQTFRSVRARSWSQSGRTLASLSPQHGCSQSYYFSRIQQILKFFRLLVFTAYLCSTILSCRDLLVSPTYAASQSRHGCTCLGQWPQTWLGCCRHNGEWAPLLEETSAGSNMDKDIAEFQSRLWADTQRNVDAVHTQVTELSHLHKFSIFQFFYFSKIFNISILISNYQNSPLHHFTLISTQSLISALQSYLSYCTVHSGIADEGPQTETSKFLMKILLW